MELKDEAECSDEEGDRFDGEEELAAPDWRVRAGPSTNRHTRKEKSMKQRTCRSETGAHTPRWAEGAPSPLHQTKERTSVEKTHHCDGLLLHENEDREHHE